MAAAAAKHSTCHGGTQRPQGRDRRDNYVAVANKLENEYGLGQLAFDPQKIVELETCLAGR